MSIVCTGEILWDKLPGGLFLGGAPFNVACHLHMMGNGVTMLSRVGDDEPGRSALKRMRQLGMNTELVQTDRVHATGLVNVTLDSKGNASYEIVEPAAWDFIELDEKTSGVIKHTDVLVFGSLAQRSPVSASTITSLKKSIPVTVFDVNLRKPYDNPGTVASSMKNTTIVKLNDHELRIIAGWFGLPGEDEREAAAALSEKFGCRSVCITRGELGSALWREGSWSEHQGYRVKVKDTVGSGDAFLAAFISGMMNGLDSYSTLSRANATGAYVATCNGATPALDPLKIEAIISNGA